MQKFGYYLTTLFVLAMLNSNLWACSSCNTAAAFSKEKIDAYFNASVFLGTLPLIFLGLLIYFVYKQAKSSNR